MAGLANSGSAAFNAATVPGEKSGRFILSEEQMSAYIPARPPDSVHTASPLPFGTLQRENMPTVSTSSSMLSRARSRTGA